MGGGHPEPQTTGLPLGPGFARCRERVTFLCLCKESVTQRKHTPSAAPGAARRVHGFRGVFRQDILVLSKNARRPAARPAGLVRETRRVQGPRQIKTRAVFPTPPCIRKSIGITHEAERSRASVPITGALRWKPGQPANVNP
jgi:hypothetical protein